MKSVTSFAASDSSAHSLPPVSRSSTPDAGLSVADMLIPQVTTGIFSGLVAFVLPFFRMRSSAAAAAAGMRTGTAAGGIHGT